MELTAIVSIADKAAELTKAFVRSFLACRNTGCKSNICESSVVGFRREMTMGKLPHAVLLSLLGAGLVLAWQPVAAETLAPSCAGAQRPKQVAELLFGRDIGRHRGVSESAFAHFVARELSPRFPDGLTITDATGQRRDPADGSCAKPRNKSKSCCRATPTTKPSLTPW